MKDPLHREEIAVYQQRFGEEKLFDSKNPEEYAREIVTVYDDAVKSGYALTPTDVKIHTSAEVILKTIRHNTESIEKYPDALERIAKYQQAYRDHKLTPLKNVRGFMQEIIDVYLAAAHLDYHINDEDLSILMIAHVLLRPSMLEELIDRIERNAIVDEKDNPAKE